MRIIAEFHGLHTNLTRLFVTGHSQRHRRSVLCILQATSKYYRPPLYIGNLLHSDAMQSTKQGVPPCPAPHPFSIAVLTSPDRRRPRVPHRLSTPTTTSADAADAHPKETSGVAPSALSVVTTMDAPTFPPQPSPMSSTGSADCSPDTSFSSAASSAAPSSPEPPLLFPVSRACSPAASEDSGRGSPVPVVTDAGSETGSQQSVEKPPHSYIALISMAILGSPDRKLVLSDIYQYIMDHFPYYSNQERAWRNSIRHNLSLNECFIKAGRADNGKGNFWAVHPACVEDFAKGDFRRRQARRRARATATVGDQMAAAALAFRCASYVPMTSSPAYHPYLVGAGGVPAGCFPSYFPAASYTSLYPSAAALSAAPTSLASVTTTTSTAPTPASLSASLPGLSPHLHALSDHPSLQTSPSLSSAASHHSLMAAYSSWYGGVPHTAPQMAPPSADSVSSSVSSRASTSAYPPRYSPYGRLPTQLMW